MIIVVEIEKMNIGIRIVWKIVVKGHPKTFMQKVFQNFIKYL